MVLRQTKMVSAKMFFRALPTPGVRLLVFVCFVFPSESGFVTDQGSPGFFNCKFNSHRVERRRVTRRSLPRFKVYSPWMMVRIATTTSRGLSAAKVLAFRC
jgi:hypothetical protein